MAIWGVDVFDADGNTVYSAKSYNGLAFTIRAACKQMRGYPSCWCGIRRLHRDGPAELVCEIETDWRGAIKSIDHQVRENVSNRYPCVVVRELNPAYFS